MENFWQNINFQNIGLESIPQNASEPVGWIILAIIGLAGLAIASIFLIGVYIYSSLALSALAKKMNCKKAWLAWIPVVNLFLLPVLADKKWVWGFLFFVPVISTILFVICLWAILEKRGYDGKWGLIGLGGLFSKGAFCGITSVAFLIILGILAWKKK